MTEASPRPLSLLFIYKTVGPEEHVGSTLETLARHGLAVTKRTEEVVSNVSRVQVLSFRENYLSRYAEYTLDDLLPLTEERIALITKPVKVNVIQLSSQDGALSGCIRYCDRNEYRMLCDAMLVDDAMWENDEPDFPGGVLNIEGCPPKLASKIWFDLLTAWGLPTTPGGACGMSRDSDSSE